MGEVPELLLDDAFWVEYWDTSCPWKDTDGLCSIRQHHECIKQEPITCEDFDDYVMNCIVATAPW